MNPSNNDPLFIYASFYKYSTAILILSIIGYLFLIIITNPVKKDSINGLSILFVILLIMAFLYILFLWIFHYKIKNLPYYIPDSELDKKRFDVIITDKPLSLSYRASYERINRSIYRSRLDKYLNDTNTKHVRYPTIIDESNIEQWANSVIPSKSTSILISNSDQLMNGEYLLLSNLRRMGYTNVSITNM